MTSPKIQVSVVMAVKNESKYICDALDSILSQNDIIFEVIVVDDNSTDNTAKIVKDKIPFSPKLNLYQNPSTGKVSAFNYGVTKASGTHICLFAGDDIMPQDSLSKRFNFLKNISNDRPIVGLSKIRIMSVDKKRDGLVVPKRKGHGSLSGQSPLMNRKAIDLLFPVPEELPNEDTWLEIAFGYTSLVNIFHSDIICCNWRMHEGNSMNMLVPYKEYKRKLVMRRSAYALFLKTYESKLTKLENKNLKSMVEGIRCYENENVFGLLRTKTSLMWKIRILSTINPFFYRLRTVFYNTLTGW